MYRGDPIKNVRHKYPKRNFHFLNFGTVFLTAMKMMKLRKAHCSPLLVGEDNSMVFTSHSVPFPATRDLSVTRGWKWHLARDKSHFIFFTPVTVNKYSWFSQNAKLRKISQLYDRLMHFL